MSALTTILHLIKNADSDGARTALNTDIPASFDIIDALFHATTGHKHTGTGTDGPLIPAAEAWTDCALGLVQGAGVATSIVVAKYQKFGRLVVVEADLAAQAAGGAAVTIAITGLSGVIAPRFTELALGSFWYHDQSVGWYGGVAMLNVGGSLYFVRDGQNATLGGDGIVIANTDHLMITLTYEAAS